MLDLRHLVGAEGDTKCVTQVVHGAERLDALGHPQRQARPPVAPDGRAQHGLDPDTPLTSGQLGADRVTEHRPLAVAKCPFLRHRPLCGRCLRFGDRVLPVEAPLVGGVDEQVGSRLDVSPGVEDLDDLPLGSDHLESLDPSISPAVALLSEQRELVAVRVLRAAHGVAALEFAPCRLGHEGRLATDTLPDLDAGAVGAVFLLSRPPAAELHGAVGNEVDPAPVCLVQERRRCPRLFLAAGCPAHENPARGRVSLRNLDVGRDVDPGGVDVMAVSVGLVELRCVVRGDFPRLRPDGFRLGMARLGATPDLDAACSAVVADGTEPNLYTLACRVPLVFRVQHPDSPAVVARLAEVALVHAPGGAGRALAELNAVRRHPHLQVARLRPVDAAPVGAEHQGEGFAPGIRRFELAQTPGQGCGDCPGIAHELVRLLVDEARCTKHGTGRFKDGGCTVASSGRIGVRHRPPPMSYSVDGMCSTLARV